MLSEAEMIRLWEQHTELEFATRDAAATVATMTPPCGHWPALWARIASSTSSSSPAPTMW